MVCTTLAAQQYAEFESALLTAINDTVLTPEDAGVVREIHAQPGTDVQRADVIVVLNKETFAAELRVAEAEKVVAEIEASNDVNIQYAKKTFEVSQKLLNRSQRARQQYEKAVTQTDMDRLQLELEQSRLSQRQARLQLDIAHQTTRLKAEKVNVARLRLANRDIRAPIDGRIEEVFVQPGQWIDAGSPIARIVDLKSLRVKAIFPLEHYLNIQTGNSASYEYRMGERELELGAVVTYVSSVVRDNVFQVWVDIDNSDLILTPGVQGKLRIELSK